jgi:hypothetical protein
MPRTSQLNILMTNEIPCIQLENYKYVTYKSLKAFAQHKKVIITSAREIMLNHQHKIINISDFTIPYDMRVFFHVNKPTLLVDLNCVDIYFTNLLENGLDINTTLILD